jgi:hypothetical protein
VATLRFGAITLAAVGAAALLNYCVLRCPICVEPKCCGGEGKKVWLSMKFSAFKQCIGLIFLFIFFVELTISQCLILLSLCSS